MTAPEAQYADTTATAPPASAEIDPVLSYGLENLLTYGVQAVATIALSPLWYLAFPVTLPLSIGIGFLFDQLPTWGLFPGFGGALGPVGSVLFGIGAFALLPVITIAAQLSLVASTVSLIQTAIANPSAASSEVVSDSRAGVGTSDEVHASTLAIESSLAAGEEEESDPDTVESVQAVRGSVRAARIAVEQDLAADDSVPADNTEGGTPSTAKSSVDETTAKSSVDDAALDSSNEKSNAERGTKSQAVRGGRSG